MRGPAERLIDMLANAVGLVLMAIFAAVVVLGINWAYHWACTHHIIMP